MRKHLSIKLAFILFGMTACVVILSILFNSIFLERYYINNKSNELVETYETINDIYSLNAPVHNDTIVDIISNCERNSISLLLIDSSLNIKLSSGYSVEGDNLLSRLKDLIFGEEESERSHIQNKNSYSIYEIYDDVAQSNYLEMYGSLDSGEIFVMRSSIDGIRESIAVSNRFSIYVALALIVTCSIVIIFISITVAKPIKNLAKISQRMSNLDFSAKYKGKESDEIGLLGQSMNIMSDTLENNISELKQANIVLKQDIKEKDKIDEMRKEFISNVSHELKTPISIISGYAEGLKESVNDDQESRDFYCDVIIDETNKMNKMVMKLLTLSQIEFGNSQIEMERFDIVEVIRQILANFKVLLDERDIKVVFDDTQSFYVWSDEFQISEVITNYISNAINHIDGEKIIFINICKNNELVKVSVRNTGAPIPEHLLEKVWIKFFKVDKARTREYGGSGIGLSIVKAIMESLNQKYGVKNTEDGVEFYFTVESEKDIH